MKLCNMSDTRNKILITQHFLNNKKKHNLLSLSFLFYERKLNTNLSFISGDFSFSGQLLNSNYTHTHTSSNVNVININKKNQNMLSACSFKHTYSILFQVLFSFQGITNQTIFYFRTLSWHHYLNNHQH